MAIQTIDTSKTYKTTTVATVYLENGNSIGTMPTGTSMKLGSSIWLTSTRGGQITSDVNYIDKGSGTEKNARGLYISLSQVVELDANGNASADAITATGGQYKMTGLKMLDSSIKLRVKTGSRWPTYTGPSTSMFVQSTGYSAGTYVNIIATYKDQNGVTWGCPSTALNNWGILYLANGALTTVLTDDSSAMGETVPGANNSSVVYTTTVSNSNGVVTDASDDTYADMKAVTDTLRTASRSMSVAATSSLEALHKMQYVIGIPPKITPTADKQYMADINPSNNFGRCYTEMFMMGNTVCSIQPCKVKYLPGFSNDEKDTFWNAVSASVTGLDDDAGLISDNNLGLSGQLFEGQPDYNDYINTVNLLARTMAIYLGIGDKTYMGKSTKYRNMDYSFYKIQANATNVSGSSNGVFGAISDTIRQVTGAAVGAAVTSVINDDTYIHFYATADGTSINENMSVSTRSSGLEALFNNNLSEIAQEIQFLAGGSSGIDFQSAINDAMGSLQGVASSMGPTLGNIVKYAGNYLKGGRLVFPQMLDDCTYDRSYTVSCRFISPSGDPEAIFLNCYLPLCYILPYVIPQMLSDNMYRYPFLARVNCKGLFHCDLAAVTSLRMQRGGADGTNFTADGLPFEIDVSFDITPLYSKLMVTTARHPILFLSNTALQEYLGALCGVSFMGNQLELKLNILRTLLGNELSDTIPSMLRGYYDSGVANFMRRFFNF